MRKAVALLFVAFSTPASALECPYELNLADERVYWGSVLSNQRLPFIRGQGVVADGPWYIDINHRERALLVGPLVVWTNGHKPADEPQVPLGRVDLTHTDIRLRVKLDHSRWGNEFDAVAGGGQLVFWFQSQLSRKAVAGGDYEMPTRGANYVLSRNLLPDAIAGNTVEISIRPDMNQWVCLGSNPDDLRPLIGSAAKYTCALDHEEFAEAMSRPADMGLLFLLPSHHPNGEELAWLHADRPARTPTMGATRFTLSDFTVMRTPLHADRTCTPAQGK